MRGPVPAFLSFGFRPFFLLGAIYAAAVMAAWPAMWMGVIAPPAGLTAVDWHVHELLFGYLSAIIAGFLLTAVPNWSGRPPLKGPALLCLVLLWSAGRLAVHMGDGGAPAGIADAVFLLALGGFLAREITVSRNWRNLMVLAPLFVFLAADGLFHLQVHLDGGADHARRLGIGAAVMLVLIIGGRITPNFTRNWLVRQAPGALPARVGRFDGVTLVVSAAALSAWVLAPLNPATGGLMIAAGVVNLIRLARWTGYRTWGEPLVAILHVGYGFAPLGLLLSGLAAFDPARVPPLAGLHAFGAGVIGVMTLAVMTRATLGHTGRALHADRLTVFIYAAIILAAVTRIVGAFRPEAMGFLHASATLWTVAFLMFTARYGPMLARPRAQP